MSKRQSGRLGFWTVPNVISLTRLGLGWVAFALIGVGWFGLALTVFAVAASTDWVDGYLARRLDQATAIGRQLDPLIDKILVLGALILLVPIDGSGVSGWAVVAIVSRELVVQAVRSRMEGLGTPFGARAMAKWKTCLQMLAVVLVLVQLALPAWLSGWTWAVPTLLWLAVGLTIVSGVQYVVAAWPHLMADDAYRPNSSDVPPLSLSHRGSESTP